MIRSLMIGAALVALATAANGRQLDPSKPEDALELNKRTGCGAKDGEAAVYHWSGKVYSRVDGETDKLLFTAEGMNIRQCVAVTDPVRGKGYRHVSREVMFFTDPKTGQILRQWANPWTGETVEVMQVHNDPVNARALFPIGADGKPFTIQLQASGAYTQMAAEAPLFYRNPLAGDYQDYVGGQYHAMEIFDFTMPTQELFDTKYPTVYPSVAWVRISKWMPWMRMGDRQGQLVFNAMGSKLHGYAELPAVIKDEIAAHYPEFTAPPPGDDPRPNATTWTVFKGQIDAARKAAAPTK
jgi:hypothetical protein